MSVQDPKIPETRTVSGSVPDKKSGKIGPNSLIQTVKTLNEFYGKERASEILTTGGQGHLLSHLPGEMINEDEFIALARMLYRQLSFEEAWKVLRRSGNLTGQYVLDNRLPKPVQTIIKLMPRPVRLKMMLSAISKNAWTFVGSGTYSFVLKPQPAITIQNTILHYAVNGTKPACSYYLGSFERLLQTLVDKGLQIDETECLAGGSDHCTFQIKLP